MVLGEVASYSYFQVLGYNGGSLASHGSVAVKSIMTSVALTMYCICEKKVERLLPGR